MIDGAEIMNYLLPGGGWSITETDFDSIIYDEGIAKVTKKDFDKAKSEIESIVEARKTKIVNDKTALLDRLGISAEEASLLLS